MMRGSGQQGAFQAGFTGAENRKLAAHRDDIAHDRGQDIDALLPGKAADDAEDRGSILIQAKMVGQILAVFRTVPESAGAVVADLLIRRRIPDIGIDAVDDTVKAVDA